MSNYSVGAEPRGGAAGCSHFIIHRSCKCAPDQFIGVCKKCLEVFCSSICLQMGEHHGVVAPGSLDKFRADYDYRMLSGGYKMQIKALQESRPPPPPLLPSPPHFAPQPQPQPLLDLEIGGPGHFRNALQKITMPPPAPQPQPQRPLPIPLDLVRVDPSELFGVPPGPLGRGRGLFRPVERIARDPIGEFVRQAEESGSSLPCIPTLVFKGTRGRGKGAVGVKSPNSTIKSENSGKTDNEANKSIKNGKNKKKEKKPPTPASKQEPSKNNAPLKPTNLDVKVGRIITAIDSELEIPLGVKTILQISHIEDCSTLYFRWSRSLALFDNDRLQLLGEEAPPLSSTRWKVGEYCLLHHSGDIINKSGFYRGEILLAHPHCSFDVQLVDLGIVVQLNGDELKEIPPEFLKLRRLAVRVGLKGILPKKDSNWKNVLQRELGLEGNLAVLITHLDVGGVSSNKTRYWGKVFGAAHKDIGNLLVTLGDADSCDESSSPFNDPTKFLNTMDNNSLPPAEPLAVGSSHSVRICPGARSVSNFHIMKEEDEPSFANLSEGCNSLSSSMGHNPYNPWLTHNKGYGDLAMVYHPQERKFYRGKVTMIDYKVSARVCLIDSGEVIEAPLEEVKELPSSLKEQSPLAHPAKLPLIVKEECRADLMKRFHRLNDRGATIAKILNFEEGRYTVDFFVNDELATFCGSLLTLREASIEPELLQQIQQVERDPAPDI